MEAFQPEVTCLKIVTYRKVVAPPKGRNGASRLTDIQQILGHRWLFRRLRALHDKFCFLDTDVTAALKIISEQRRWFYESPGRRDAWSADLSAMVRSMLRDIRQAVICSPNGAWLRKLWDTSKSPLKNTPEPMAETVLDVETLIQDDSQMLVEDAQPRKLEKTLEVQGADTVGSTTDYFVWFDLELGTAWRSSTGSPPEQAVKLQVQENARGWSEYQRRRTVSSSPTPSVPVPAEKTPTVDLVRTRYHEAAACSTTLISAVEKDPEWMWANTEHKLGDLKKSVKTMSDLVDMNTLFLIGMPHDDLAKRVGHDAVETTIRTVEKELGPVVDRVITQCARMTNAHDG